MNIRKEVQGECSWETHATAVLHGDGWRLPHQQQKRAVKTDETGCQQQNNVSSTERSQTRVSPRGRSHATVKTIKQGPHRDSHLGSTTGPSKFATPRDFSTAGTAIVVDVVAPEDWIRRTLNENEEADQESPLPANTTEFP